MQIYGMDHPSLEAAFQTNLNDGLNHLETDISNKKGKKHFLSFKEFFLFFRRQFYFVDVIILISYIIAGVFSVLNGNRHVFMWTIISLILSVLMFFAACFVLFYYKNRYLARISESVPWVEVIRDGKATKISRDQLKIGDVLLLKPGVLLYGDARIIKADHLLADEATVFSTSVPSEKTDEILMDDGILPENQKNMLWKGSSITEGSGTALVVALGKDCYVEKTGGRKKKEQRSFFYNRQHNLGQIFCYTFLLLVIFSLLIVVFVSSRIIDAFLIMGLLLSVIIINPISALTEWTYYRKAERLLKEGIIIRNIEAFDRINREKNLYFEGKKLAEKNFRLKEILPICGTDEENFIYYSLCKDEDLNSFIHYANVEAARKQYPVFLHKEDDKGNLFSVFAKGGKSVLIAIGYWQKMLPYLSSVDDKTMALIHETEAAGQAVYFMVSYAFDYVPGRLETESLMGKMKLIGMPIYSFEWGNELKERLAQFKRLNLKSILISDYSEELNNALMNFYGFSGLVNQYPEEGGYSLAYLNRNTPVVFEDSAPLYREQSQIIINEHVHLWDLVYQIKCMFCGIKRCFNFLLIYFSLGALCVLPMFLYEQPVTGMIIPLLLLPVIALAPCFFLVESVKNCTQSRRSLLLGFFCGVFGLICAISDHPSALFTLEFSAVLLACYFAIVHWKTKGINRTEVIGLIFSILLSFLSLACVSGGWLVALLLSFLPLVCAIILDYLY